MIDSPVILDVSAPGILRLGDEVFRCALGPAGIVLEKREGDGGTPVGVFPLRRVMYRTDRMSRPDTRLPVRAISDSDGWCDDLGHAAYNQLVVLPHPARHERLWRDDLVYDVIVEVGFNDDPPVPGKGSAIFIHVAREGYTPTEGCVALQIDDLLHVVRACGPDAILRVNPVD